MKILQELSERSPVTKRLLSSSIIGVWILTLCLVCGVTACSSGDSIAPPPDESAEALPPEPDIAAATLPSQYVADGELIAVDLSSSTLTIKDSSGMEKQFSFTDNTGIIGVPSAQGLATKRGSPIRVGYISEESAVPSPAVWIEIESIPSETK